MFKILVEYPQKNEEMEILNKMSQGDLIPIDEVISREDLARVRARVDSIYVDDKVKNYIVDIVMATRNPADYGLGQLSSLLSVGGSPRATINLTKAAKAHAFINGRGYVTVDDVKSIGYHVLRHRLVLTYEAEAENVSSDDLIKEILGSVEVA